MKKALGILLLSLPLIGIGGACYLRDGNLIIFAKALGITVLIVGSITVGVILLTPNR